MRDESVRQAVEEIARRFAAAWRDGEHPPAFDPFLPPCDAPARVAVLSRLVKIDQLQRWQSGEQPLLETYLRQWPELGGNAAVVSDLLHSECAVRAACGVSPTQDELQERFPALCQSDDLNTIVLPVEAREALVPHSPSRGSPDTIPTADDATPPQHFSWSISSSGARVGRYEIRALLGAGGMGEVYRAYDTELQREVALKIPRVLPGANPEVLGRFVEEALAAASLRHPHICPVYDAGQMGDRYYIVMALIEGPTLAEKLEQGPCELAFSARVVAQLARALDAAHAKGIVHRDIKPANVMLDAADQPLLTDFGLARRAEKQSHLTVAGAFLGTPAYMSPEQAAMQPMDHRTDIYSLGVVLYQMLTGHLPFPGPPAQLPLQISQGKPPKPGKLRPDLDSTLEAICLQAMARRPEQRYPTAAALADALEAYLAPGEAGPARRHRALWVTLVAVILLLSGGLAYQLTIGRARDRSTADDHLPLTPRQQRIADLEQALATSATFRTELRQIRELEEKYRQVKNNIFAMDADVVRGQSALALGRLKRYVMSSKELSLVKQLEAMLGRTGLSNVPEDTYLLVRELAEMMEVRLSGLEQELKSLSAEERRDPLAEEPAKPDTSSTTQPAPDIAARLEQTRRELAGIAGLRPDIDAIHQMDRLHGELTKSMFRNGDRATVAVRCHTHLGRIYAAALTKDELELVDRCHDVTVNSSSFREIDRMYPFVSTLALSVGARLDLLQTKMAGLQNWKPDTQWFSTLIETRPKETQSLCDRARIEACTRHYEAAIETLSAAITQSPEDATLYALRATFQIEQRNLDAAAADTERAIALAPEMGFAYYVRGNVHCARGQFTLAVGDCDQALQLDPQIKQAYVTRATAYVASGAFDRAMTDANSALELDPQCAHALRVRALAQLGMQELAKALEDSTRAIELAPLHADNHVARARVLIQQQSHPEAIDDLSEALRLGPATSEMYRLRSTCYEAAGDPVRAAADGYRAQEPN